MLNHVYYIYSLLIHYSTFIWRKYLPKTKHSNDNYIQKQKCSYGFVGVKSRQLPCALTFENIFFA